eukprot:RCo014183
MSSRNSLPPLPSMSSEAKDPGVGTGSVPNGTSGLLRPLRSALAAVPLLPCQRLRFVAVWALRCELRADPDSCLTADDWEKLNTQGIVDELIEFAKGLGAPLTPVVTPEGTTPTTAASPARRKPATTRIRVQTAQQELNTIQDLQAELERATEFSAQLEAQIKDLQQQLKSQSSSHSPSAEGGGADSSQIRPKSSKKAHRGDAAGSRELRRSHTGEAGETVVEKGKKGKSKHDEAEGKIIALAELEEITGSSQLEQAPAKVAGLQPAVVSEREGALQEIQKEQRTIQGLQSELEQAKEASAQLEDQVKHLQAQLKEKKKRVVPEAVSWASELPKNVPELETALQTAQAEIDRLTKELNKALAMLAKFQAAMATNVVEGVHKFTAGLDQKQERAPLEDDGKPLTPFMATLATVVLTLAQKYEVCPICQGITSDLCDHLGKEKKMTVKVPLLSGAQWVTTNQSVLVHYYCPDPDCKFHDVAHHLQQEETTCSEGKEGADTPAARSVGAQQYLAEPLYEHFLTCHATDTKACTDRALREIEYLRNKALAAKIAAGKVLAQTNDESGTTGSTSARPSTETAQVALSAEDRQANVADFTKWFRKFFSAVVKPTMELILSMLTKFVKRFHAEHADVIAEQNLTDDMIAVLHAYTLETEIYRRLNAALRSGG